MTTKRELNSAQRDENRITESGDTGAVANAHAPGKMTFAENVVLTIKLLGGFGLAGAALWGLDLWISAR